MKISLEKYIELTLHLKNASKLVIWNDKLVVVNLLEVCVRLTCVVHVRFSTYAEIFPFCRPTVSDTSLSFSSFVHTIYDVTTSIWTEVFQKNLGESTVPVGTTGTEFNYFCCHRSLNVRNGAHGHLFLYGSISLSTPCRKFSQFCHLRGDE